MEDFAEAAVVIDGLIDTWWAEKETRALAILTKIYPMGGPRDIDDWLAIREALLKIRDTSAIASLEDYPKVARAIQLIDQGLGMA